MPTDAATSRVSAARLVAVVCAAQVMVQIGAYFWPALLPEMKRLYGEDSTDTLVVRLRLAVFTGRRGIG